MRRSIEVALVLLTVSLLCGCAGPGAGGREQAEELAAWLEAQSYSSWFAFKHEGEDPEMPAGPDGMTLGSPNVFAALGCDPDDLTSLDVFWADRRTVRPLAKPLTLALRVGGGEGLIPLAEAEVQTLRRVRHTAIAVSESELDGLRVRCVNFAPMGRDQNFLARWFLFENTGGSKKRVRLAARSVVPGEWSRASGGAWQRGDRLALLSDAELNAREEYIEVDVGSVRPGGRAAAALLLVGAKDQDSLDTHVAGAEDAMRELLPILDATRDNWEKWCGRSPLNTGDERTDDLLDSLLCLVRSHVGPEGIHTGSVRYRHDRAYVRDSYWVERALLELGRVDEARLNLDFFHRAWQASGLGSYYEIPSGAGAGYGYHGVELPHYLVLMVREAERMGGVDPLPYWDMVKGCLDEAAAPESGLQPMNGDETWLLAAPVRELDDLLDNSWLLIASAEYGAELAARAGDTGRAARYQVMALQARAALSRFVPRQGEAEWYATGRGGGGSLDFSLCPGVLARGAVLGVLPASDPYLCAGLQTSWSRLRFERGLRAHSRSATIDGGTPGYVLYAAAESPACEFAGELARRVQGFASATGCVWEFHDMQDPSWGGEKRRLWDSAVLLMGLVHSHFDIRPSANGPEFIPKRPGVAASSTPEPPFDAEALVADPAGALILHDRSPEHGFRLARELLRQRNQQYAVAEYRGEPPADGAAIIVSRAGAPAGWIRNIRGYWVREWEGPPQLWVRNTGDVYRDTDPVLLDLLSLLTPQREKPLPFSDANFDLVARYGERPSGRAELVARSGGRTARGLLDLAGGRATLKAGRVELRAKAARGEHPNVLRLSFEAGGSRPDAAELSVTLPAGWWVVRARDMTGGWDRVHDPVGQIRLSDGRIRLVCSLRAGEDPFNLALDMARLQVKTR